MSFRQYVAISKQFLQRLLPIARNRLELLLLEVQEERKHLLHALILLLGLGLCGFMAVLLFTTFIIVAFWSISPWGVLLVLTVAYLGAAVWILKRLKHLFSELDLFTESRAQLRKDREELQQLLQ